jgi:hypothetical protein
MKSLKLAVALCVVSSFSAGVFAGSCCSATKKAAAVDCKDGKKGSSKDGSSTPTVSLSKVEDKKA